MTLSETFENLDWSAIESYVKLAQEENLHLDFKLVKSADLSSTDDKRNLARALSGFANSSGGMIVWGVDARRNVDGIDSACNISEIAKPALLVSRLNALTGEATSPLIDGIRHQAIFNNATGAGLVATLVPESDGGPYMAKLGENRYYKRSGDSFYQMEHFDLADMFGRRQKPDLDITVTEGEFENGVETIILRLTNTGRATAKHAGLLMTFLNAKIESTTEQLCDWSGINEGLQVVGYSNDIGVIHPTGIPLIVGQIKLRREDPAQIISANLTLYCEGAPKVVRTLQLLMRANKIISSDAS